MYLFFIFVSFILFFIKPTFSAEKVTSCSPDNLKLFLKRLMSCPDDNIPFVIDSVKELNFVTFFCPIVIFSNGWISF